MKQWMKMWTWVSLLAGMAPSIGLAKTPCFKPAWRSLSQEKQLELCSQSAPTRVQECLQSPSEFINRATKKEICGLNAFHTMDCLNAQATLLSNEDKVQLCTQAYSSSPIDCFNRAPSVVKKENKIRLCAGAFSLGPVQCFSSAAAVLNDEEKVKLCQQAVSQIPAECFNSASSLLSQSEKIELCQGVSSLNIINCYNQAPSYLGKREKIKICREKFDI
jgi:hypothetical protein